MSPPSCAAPTPRPSAPCGRSARKVCAPGAHGSNPAPGLTKLERAALDAWLAERMDLVLEAILHDGLSLRVGHGGSPKGRKRAPLTERGTDE